VEEFSDTAAEGLVFKQSVSDGTKVAEGTKVTIYVSKGPDPSVETTLRVKLPGTWNNRKVEVKLNGKTVKTEDNVLMSGTYYSVTVSGYGAADSFEVYIDGQLYYSCKINFASNPPKTYDEATYSISDPTPSEPDNGEDNPTSAPSSGTSIGG
ncbi:MAG: PASTA domain-containing protein, partial [Acutalibacteraceae bacterium]